jgi:hypothetical protein
MEATSSRMCMGSTSTVVKDDEIDDGSIERAQILLPMASADRSKQWNSTDWESSKQASKQNVWDS